MEFLRQKMFWDATPVHLEAEWGLCSLGSEGIAEVLLGWRKNSFGEEEDGGGRGWGKWAPRGRTR